MNELKSKMIFRYSYQLKHFIKKMKTFAVHTFSSPYRLATTLPHTGTLLTAIGPVRKPPKHLHVHSERHSAVYVR